MGHIFNHRKNVVALYFFSNSLIYRYFHEVTKIFQENNYRPVRTLL